MVIIMSKNSKCCIRLETKTIQKYLKINLKTLRVVDFEIYTSVRDYRTPNHNVSMMTNLNCQKDGITLSEGWFYFPSFFLYSSSQEV